MLQPSTERSALNEYRTCINCHFMQKLRTNTQAPGSTAVISTDGSYCEKHRDEVVTWHWCNHWSVRRGIGPGVLYVFDRVPDKQKAKAETA